LAMEGKHLMGRRHPAYILRSRIWVDRDVNPHRLNGPAIEGFDGYKAWYRHGFLWKRDDSSLPVEWAGAREPGPVDEFGNESYNYRVIPYEYGEGSV